MGGGPLLSRTLNSAKYAGLTDDPARRKVEHGNPTDWLVVKSFTSEPVARAWEQSMMDAGYSGDTGGAGWKYGYTYTKGPGTTP